MILFSCPATLGALDAAFETQQYGNQQYTGFYISYLLVAPIGKFIGTGFQIYTSGLMSNASLGAGATPVAAGLAGIAISSFVSLLATITVGMAILALAEHQVFSLVTRLPENVMRWVEGQMGGLGEHEKESKIQGLVMAKFGRMEGASKSAAKAGSRSRDSGRFSKKDD